MDAEELNLLAKRCLLNREFIRNEEATKQSLVVPFIRALGYDPGDPREVRLEYAAPFTLHDGKRYADRMDFAIFRGTTEQPIIVIETKPLGTDVRVRSPQLSRYMSQLPDLRFGIMTDGCHYLFFGDLQRPNIMDDTPFFQFSLDDPKLDVGGVAAFLTQFSRDQFDPNRLVTEAEDSRYRQGMVRKLTTALREPTADVDFVRWLSDGVYQGNRTRQVMERLAVVAQSAIKLAMLRVIGDDFLNELREQIAGADGREDPTNTLASGVCENEGPGPEDVESQEMSEGRSSRQRVVITSEEEIVFADAVRGVCRSAGIPDEEIVHKDTVNYFGMGHRFPSRWFIRYFADKRRKAITTLVATEEARQLAPEHDVEDAPPVFGVSRVYVEGPESVGALADLILRSLDICKEKASGS